ncbi:hypothetical protein [Micromonospora sp. NPDC005979]|uniref:hypothetical protein n=1 Tax=Micromonospora sp. NPDC005979 TaxID=3156726 RepID=UPI0033ADECD5
MIPDRVGRVGNHLRPRGADFVAGDQPGEAVGAQQYAVDLHPPAAALVLTLAGCSDGTPDDEPTGRAASVSPTPVRTDRDPIAKRFPRLGDFIEAHWQAATAGGSGRDTVPGPTDTRIEALVVLRPDTLATTIKGYEWQPAPPDWDAPLSGELRPFLPTGTGGTWQVSEEYACGRHSTTAPSTSTLAAERSS